jgi:hypothetical protein
MSNLGSITEAEAKELATEFYRLIDTHAPAEDFKSILSEDAFRVVLPNVEINNFEEFKAWHARMVRGFFDGSHKIYDVKLVSTSDAETTAKIVLVWDAKVWNPPAAKSEPTSILTYTTYVIKRSPKTKKPVVASYVLDLVQFAAGLLQKTPE